jgi:CHAD domain-containing protein
MADGKWISGLKSTTPLTDAARRVLAVRLEVVHSQLPLALHDWQEDPEHVHQLRVGTRRAGAALAIFGFCLPIVYFKKLKKRLRAIRRAAGAARDWDVFAMALAEREKHVTAGQRAGLDFLLGYAQAQRVAAQATLEQVGERKPFALEHLIADALAAIQLPAGSPRQCLGDVARPWLAEILMDLHTAGTSNLDQYEHLHQARILGKRLRYGMEVFASCFGADFKDRFYPMVEEMQDILGLANDSFVATQRLTTLRDILRASKPGMWKRCRAGVDGLMRYHQRRLPQQREHFLGWWERWEKTGAAATLIGMVQALGTTG